MKRVYLAVFGGVGLGLAAVVGGQVVYQPYQPAQVTVPVGVGVGLTSQQIDQLTGPIALYPDPLIAQILPAATYSVDLVQAAQWVKFNPNAPEAAINAQPWEEPVKALAHYPTVLDQMANNLAWAQQLGAAYLNQPGDVMNSIQRLRAQAQAAGSLVSTPQQQVISDGGAIYIIPAQPEVVYVPVYDPAVVYVRRTPLVFGAGFGIGVWLNLDADWHNRYVVTGVRWDRAHWERYRDLPRYRPGPGPRPSRPAWVRDPGRPVVVPAPRVDPGRRFYPTPNAGSPPRGFGDYRSRGDVVREENRGRASLGRPSGPSAPVARPSAPPVAKPSGQPAGAKPSAPAGGRGAGQQGPGAGGGRGGGGGGRR